MKMKRFLSIVQIILVIIIIIFGYKIVQTYIEDKQERANYEKIQQKFQTLATKHQASIRPQFEELEKINKDIVGWIKLPGTSLNYPVLQGKTNHDYLNLDFEREHRRKGSIFMDFRNTLQTLNYNTILYGHHVGDNTMFDVLEDYLKQPFFEKHKTIEFDNKYGKYQLQVFSAYKTTTKDNYIRTTFDNEQDYQRFLDETKRKSVIKSDVNISVKDKIMTLSTCEDAYSETAKRIVVVAKIIKIS
ncbi:SrtB family sortase [Staphylococcus schweitzeri]|uniref:Class B sortase n=1 Tax=Staphylococcus schweitzeri TaxID=1654388 RepID=A0A2K4AL73_9STAP|nr:class B sortase [Staphylococcus schweitzeri]MBE2128807.1 class B sortase [Staphylococcus schweitzeri]PNZ50836.1 SrtB family sortase [Staphylococcus schweitzeri]CDR54617.1 sortase [Staphylococcus schweitzeri]CDR61206.1 sortase [Staphylococcus schweitzeri]VEE65663.1 Sortase (surface protein transpeptidase) [Staphylococcus schweitzeri]